MCDQLLQLRPTSLPTKLLELKLPRSRRTPNRVSWPPWRPILNKSTRTCLSELVSPKAREMITPESFALRLATLFRIMRPNSSPRLSQEPTRASPSRTPITSVQSSSMMFNCKTTWRDLVCPDQASSFLLSTDWNLFKNCIFSSKREERTISAERLVCIRATPHDVSRHELEEWANRPKSARHWHRRHKNVVLSQFRLD